MIRGESHLRQPSAGDRW